MALEGDVGRMQVEHDLLWPAAVRRQKQGTQQAIQCRRRVTRLEIATGTANQFQPVHRVLASQRLVQIALAAQQGPQRIAAQLLVEVFIVRG